MGGNMRVAIYTLTQNRLELTKEMIKSLDDNTHISFDHYIIDQGSTDGTIEWLKTFTYKLGKLYIFPLAQNIGINSGDNFALDRIGKKYDVIIKLDNDALIMTDCWLEKCLSVLKPKLLVSPFILGLLDNRGGIPRYAYDKENNLGYTPALGGICLIGQTRAWFKDSGSFPTNMPASYHHDDMEFCARLKNKGYKFVYKEDVIIRHLDNIKQKN
jgi:GT2 family glycosyltransferase